MTFMTQGGLTSIHLPNQEVPEYPQKHALILHVKRPYRFKEQFWQLFFKGFLKGRMGVLIFRCCSSNISAVFSSNFVTSFLNSDPLSH